MREIELFKGVFNGETGDEESNLIETIYIGGGTPSLLTNEELTSLMGKLREQFIISSGTEITLEANPDDITEPRLLEWKAAGINRLSIGVQSFFEEDLRWMNRAHNAIQAEAALRLALQHFDNITMDLIYGTPGLTDEKWKANVRKAIALGIPHLSCYALTVEPSTPLHKLISQHKLEDVDPERQSAQFIQLMGWLEAAGFEHYEISNFARPGFRSRHNSSYWQGKAYYGFGPSAHSFNSKERWWNIANNPKYIAAINDGQIPFEKEVLTPVQRFNEFVMISLRTGEGLDLLRFRDNEWDFENDRLVTLGNEMMAMANDYASKGLLVLTGDRIVLTREGRLLADGIAADFFTE